MRTEREIAEAVRDWAGSTLSITHRYAYRIGLKGSMPDVVAVVQRSRYVRSDPAFPYPELQQAWLLVFEVEVSVAVDKGDTDGDAEEVEQTLQGYGTTLRSSALADTTLGNRVTLTSPLIDIDYSAPPAEDEGGIKARMMFVNLSVAELGEEPA
jgi:hypothetical protein